MIWVYGICEGPAAPPDGEGLAQAPLDGVREGELLAVVSRHAEQPGDPALEALWAHERVVERIMADRAVLPMRFGTTVRHEDELREVLATRREELLAALARVRGRVEVGVRAVQGGEDSGPVATTGREYVEAKLRVGHAAAALHEPLASLAVAASQRPARGPDELLRAAYLIDAGALEGFRGAVERLQQAHPEVSVLCTGPWPPYSFVGGAG
jgi:hypothetical protein